MASRRKLYRRHGLPLSRGVDRDGTFYCPLVLRYVRFFSAEEIFVLAGCKPVLASPVRGPLSV